MIADACGSSRRDWPVVGSGASPSAMSASVASIMKSPTRVRSADDARGGSDGVRVGASIVSRRRRSVTRNPSSDGDVIGRSLAHAKTLAV